MKLTILGCGPSGGVPLVGNVWGRCDPQNPKNYRLRTSLLIEDQGHKILIDTSPDLRQQLLRVGISQVDAVLYTHAHSDHAHGIDELRPMYFSGQRQSIPIYGQAHVLNEIQDHFGYLFMPLEDPDQASIYPRIFNPQEVKGEFELFGHKIISFEQDHGHSISTGYRFERFAYSTDVKALDAGALEVLAGVDTWFVDCLDYTPRPTHAHLEQTLAWIDQVKPRRAILIHMNQNLDYEELRAQLPAHVEPAFDGMVIEV